MYQDLRFCSMPVLQARDMAAGWGVDRTVSDAMRVGWLPATSQARAPPQSWPTRWTRSRPDASMSARTSATSSSRR